MRANVRGICSEKKRGCGWREDQSWSPHSLPFSRSFRWSVFFSQTRAIWFSTPMIWIFECCVCRVALTWGGVFFFKAHGNWSRRDVRRIQFCDEKEKGKAVFKMSLLSILGLLSRYHDREQKARGKPIYPGCEIGLPLIIVMDGQNHVAGLASATWSNAKFDRFATLLSCWRTACWKQTDQDLVFEDRYLKEP